jgi:valyl-tRNA synthetase
VTAAAHISAVLDTNADLICNLAGIEKLTAGAEIARPKNAATAIVDDMQVYVHDVIDPQAERDRLLSQKQDIEKAKLPLQAKLGNDNFLSKAKPHVVEQARERLAQLSEQLQTIDKNLLELDV